MSWPVDIYRGQWRRCGDCGESFTDRSAHEKQHIERPSDSHLTLAEAAKALGRHQNTVRYWIKTGKIRHERHARGFNRTWITRQAIRNFVASGVVKNLGLVVEWAKTGEVRG
jgi:excisionase family DNA binding protein